jgi:hypothetical protein
MFLAYLVYWLLQNDGVKSIGDQKGFLSMRDMEGEERQRRSRTPEVVPAKKYAGGKEVEIPRLGPRRMPQRNYLADMKLKERPRSPRKIPTEK